MSSEDIRESGNGHWPEEPAGASATDPGDVAGVSFERSYVASVPRRPGVKVDVDFIERVLGCADAESIVAKYHCDLFLAAYGAVLGKLQGARVATHAYIARQAKVVAALEGRLARTDRFLRTAVAVADATTSAWTLGDRCTWALLFLVSVGALALGINNVATYLIGSGFIVFAQNRPLAYLLSSVTVPIALGIKYGVRLPETDRGRKVFRWTTWSAAALFGIVWITSFAALFPQIQTRDVADIVRDLLTTTEGSKSRLENIFVGSQVFCEILSAVVLFDMMSELSASHRVRARPTNPEYAACASTLDEERGRLSGAVKYLDELRGAIRSYEAMREVLVADACSRCMAAIDRHRRRPFRTDDDS